MHRRHADISEWNPEEGVRILRGEKKILFCFEICTGSGFFFFLDYHINFCLFTEQVEVLILEAVSKLT